MEKSYRNILVVIDNFSKYGWRIASNNETAKTSLQDYSKKIHKLNRKPSLTETDDGKFFVEKIHRKSN